MKTTYYFGKDKKFRAVFEPDDWAFHVAISVRCLKFFWTPIVHGCFDWGNWNKNPVRASIIKVLRKRSSERKAVSRRRREYLKIQEILHD